MDKVITRLKGAKKILLLCHVSPDGDCIGSMLALGRALKKLGKSVSMASEDEIPQLLRFMYKPEEIVLTKDVASRFDLAVAIDSGDENRLGTIGQKLFRNAPYTINIDHHSSNPFYGDLNLIKPEKAATGEIILELIGGLGLELENDLAEPLYTAILTDTGGFRFSNTTDDTFKNAAVLVKFGADPHQISHTIYENKSLSYFKMLALAFERFIVDDTICYTYISYRDLDDLGLDFGAAEELSTYAKMIAGTEIALVFKEKEEGIIKVSFRSHGTFDVAKLAEKFGGGGHKRAAGCSIESSLNDAIKKVLLAVKEVAY